MRSTTKPPIFVVLTKHYVSEAFRLDVVNKSMFFTVNNKTVICQYSVEV